MRRDLLVLIATVLVAASASGDDFRATPPVVSPPLRLPPEALQEARLPNGVRVLVVQEKGGPVLSLEVVSDLGALDSAAGVGCLALATAWPREDSATVPAIHVSNEDFEIQRVLRKVADREQTLLRWDSEQVAYQTIAPGLEDALQTAVAVATDPELDRPLIDDGRNFLAKRLERERWNAHDALHGELYAAGDPMHDPFCGSKASFQQVTHKQLEDHLARAYAPNHTTLVVVGDTTLEKVVEAATKAFPKAPTATSATTVDPPLPPPTARREILLLDRPGTTQADIATGAATAPRASPDHAPLAVLARAIEARLYRVLRQQYGYTYGFHAISSAGRSRGELVVWGKVDVTHAGDSVHQLVQEIADLRDKPLSDADLLLAKQEASERDPRYSDLSEVTAEALAELAVTGLPLDTWTREADAIAHVTAADVQRVARTYLDPAHVPIVVVGDASKIRPTLPDVGGPVRVETR